MNETWIMLIERIMGVGSMFTCINSVDIINMSNAIFK